MQEKPIASAEVVSLLREMDTFKWGKFDFFFCLSSEYESSVKGNNLLTLEQPYIRKPCLYTFDPIKPHFYIVKPGFTGVYIIFLTFVQKHRLWVLAEAVLTSTHNLCFEKKYEKYQNFLSENFTFFGCNLNRRGFVIPFFEKVRCAGKPRGSPPNLTSL